MTINREYKADMMENTAYEMAAKGNWADALLFGSLFADSKEKRLQMMGQYVEKCFNQTHPLYSLLSALTRRDPKFTGLVNNWRTQVSVILKHVDSRPEVKAYFQSTIIALAANLLSAGNIWGSFVLQMIAGDWR